MARVAAGSAETVAPECPLWVCAVQSRRFPVGANLTRQPLQPEAIGAVMEVTKWLKPSIILPPQPTSAAPGDFTLSNVRNARQWRTFADWRSVSRRQICLLPERN